jgi:hypothetical protein
MMTIANGGHEKKLYDDKGNPLMPSSQTKSANLPFGIVQYELREPISVI